MTASRDEKIQWLAVQSVQFTQMQQHVVANNVAFYHATINYDMMPHGTSLTAPCSASATET